MSKLQQYLGHIKGRNIIRERENYRKIQAPDIQACSCVNLSVPVAG